eukprot:scaffold38287_cov214-Amphora_coffeaeformis.AAC.2
MEYWVGVPTMLRQLSVFNGKGAASELPNLWTDEIAELQKPVPKKDKHGNVIIGKAGRPKLGKNFNHTDNSTPSSSFTRPNRPM